MSERVLVVEDDPNVREVLTLILEESAYEVRAAPDGEAAWAELDRQPYDVVITDVRMPKVGGLELLDHLRQAAPETTVIVMSAYGTHAAALEAMKRGAYDYLSKPFKPDEVVLVLAKARERERLRRENARLRAELDERAGGAQLDALIGASPSMQQIFQKIRRIAQYKTTTLLQGESGTGKELVARAIHRLSDRASAPFVPVNCGAIPEALMESELFGHVKGAFTGATQARRGLAEEAEGGTLFLDEVGELPVSMQVKLLRFLQEDELRRVGESRPVTVDVRVIAATARDLEAEVAAGRFREDLYYRLSVIPLQLPPLRSREGDVPALIAHFVPKIAARLGIPAPTVSPGALQALRDRAWPGNVRELENTLEQALVLCEGEEIQAGDLPLGRPARAPEARATSGRGGLKSQLAEVEAEILREALAAHGGNRTHAARQLEISHRTLLYKIKQHGLDSS